MNDLELTNKRQAIINKMMDLALSVSAADELEEMDAKHEQIKRLKDELDQLPTLSQNSVGRPRIGKARSLKITLPTDDWDHIDSLLASGRISSYAEYFRTLHESSLSKTLIY